MSTTQTLTAQASAPGKLILFGEHSVVYGEPAIAASLSDLRIQVSAKTRSDGIIDIQLPDLPDGFSLSTKAESLRCEVSNSDLKSTPTAQDASDIHKCLQDGESSTNNLSLSESHMAAVTPLIYLFNKLVPSLLTKDTGLSLSATSINLPVGAGLGSSAAFGVSASAALYQLHLRLRLIHGESDTDESSTSTTWKGKPSNDQLNVINELAYQSEILIHGTPSGIDNTVSTYGSAIHFTKLDGGKTRNERIDAKCLPPLHVILTNTQVPRSTKVLVSHVREFKKEYPLVVEGILNAMGGITR
jgi:mevalonate kinase